MADQNGTDLVWQVAGHQGPSRQKCPGHVQCVTNHDGCLPQPRPAAKGKSPLVVELPGQDGGARRQQLGGQDSSTGPDLHDFRPRRVEEVDEGQTEGALPEMMLTESFLELGSRH